VVRLVGSGLVHADVAGLRVGELGKLDVELFTQTAKYPVGVYVLPKQLDEKVARLQLKTLNVELSQLTDTQAGYIGVDKAGPYKPDHYRY